MNRLRALAPFLVASAVAACASTVTPSDAGSPPPPPSSCALPNGGVCALGATCPAGDGCNECACTASGTLQCTQRACAGTDAGRPHPTPCHPAGQACGEDLWCCGGYCDRSDGGSGTCQPVPAGTFSCGTTYCHAGEYCELTYSDTPDPDSSTCRPIPDACGGTLSCDCVERFCSLSCSLRNGQTIVLRCLGG